MITIIFGLPSEGQRYWNSHTKDLPEPVSRAFENHGHYFLDIFIDVQRPGLINLNIREITQRFIEILEQKDVPENTAILFKRPGNASSSRPATK